MQERLLERRSPFSARIKASIGYLKIDGEEEQKEFPPTAPAAAPTVVRRDSGNIRMLASSSHSRHDSPVLTDQGTSPHLSPACSRPSTPHSFLLVLLLLLPLLTVGRCPSLEGESRLHKNLR